MQRLEVSGAVRPIYGSLGVKRLSTSRTQHTFVIGKRHPTSGRKTFTHTGLFELIVGVLTTCHTQYT